ncbi:VRR-NUC domain-containing protein [Glaciecola sp. XM2]|jgi:DNA polymerase-3 subunit epsilon|uniref:exonuclease domain-containing protein n=1 Tax=Glaciecola sp. XM2 TaxID=1914931 RepID=UPI001BDE7E2A|nr:exonuclease domain-containing protein [Glaciecola sp. XM2]MBT1451530.1 VRR-NUC domain-containing protein [Glaciecola sp. XM2]
MRRLPTYYYLTHFHEFLRFVEGPCAALLHPSHIAFLEAFHQASKDQQCLLVRCINRKHGAIKISSLVFAELGNVDELIAQLVELGWLGPITTQDVPTWLDALTKDELHTLYHASISPTEARLPKSVNRDTLLGACRSVPAQTLCDAALSNDYVMRHSDPIIDYFLYLYFGDTKSRLNQFSLRDLGVMRTRDTQAQLQSRYQCKHQALSSFLLSKYLRKVRRSQFDSASAVLQAIKDTPPVEGEIAADKHQHLMFALACEMLTFNPVHALRLLKALETDTAKEKWCREAYKLGQVEEVRLALDDMIDQPLSDKSLAFAEDFLARKYQQKRTSVLTDMLREGAHHIYLDETFKGSVERGVQAHYKHKGLQAYRTENTLWGSLFGLLFWQELFDLPGLGLATAFDHLPTCLKQNNFYAVAHEQIEAKLASFQTAKECMAILTKNAAEHHGKGQGVFQWRSDVLETLQTFLSLAPIAGVKQQMIHMAQDWQHCHNGFPDIMVIEDNRLRFEEIKGEGDVLRRNQLLCIQKLREFGFDVRITTVDFIVDPDQPYVVVDIETTGGRAANHKITEIGMVKMVRGEIVERWQSLVNPQRRIPSNITALTGIDDAMVQDAPIFAEIADEVAAFTEDCIFVAHNVNFDYGFIKEEFARLDRFWRRPKLCTVVQMRRYFKGLPSYSLANLTKHFDISMQRHHRAMSDAVAASELLCLINAKRFEQQAGTEI